MNAITSAIMSNSKLNVTLIKITDATPDSFVMSIEAEVTGTGPVGATIAEMTVELVGPGGAFGKLDLPVIKTSSSGAKVIISSQHIKISDKAAFKAFVTAILRDESLVLKLQNGKAQVKAMGMKAEIDYNKDCPLKGMNGPKTSISKTVVEGGSFKNTLVVENPSPLELDLGTIQQELRNQDGSVIATQSGKAYLSRGQSTYDVEGKPSGKAAGASATLVATGVAENNWHNETIQAFQVPVTLPAELVTICA
ncbi:uncharacterized protein L3040_002316 [Drepanopeziza brunnea f. sp. 'multigermtubi']|uniref:Uncharacterized protein n=1 Tax=Marssonina brunnea f. sp. multigermtubi (strain MB_m1) TaxID=1072389 RepID=K1X474_MARBU|nr:uncharacterized protein MBM_01958 [Drepanopeziza brunnea f. sp. 'multigermtubi' MB_m1]EKD20006.1 hypothetical protein MBM_01958 [Drepanopeziza brunnea f. sp. 'multigermtubi' MB_m1]KAJ5050433.1 hypothetical protein L3040_002316 [Drepanopeziza brunnea f. sp. 'multigermtubi']